MSLIHGGRASFPLAALGVSILAVMANRGRKASVLTAEIGFFTYGVVMLMSSMPVDPWFSTSYWAFAFLATVTVAHHALNDADRVEAARQLNWLSWIMASLVLVVLLIFARHALFDDSTTSGYGINGAVPTVGGMPMSRSSGLSRMAAVPAIISLVFLFQSSRLLRIISAAVLAGSCTVIWFMQSRGSFFGFAGTLLFVLCLGGSTARKMGFALAILVFAVWSVSSLSEGPLQDFWQHATRGTGKEGFETMSGRPAIWQDAIDVIQGSPLIGYGAQADRRELGHMDTINGINNAQNALLYALLNTGLIGTGFFVVAMLAAWRDLARLIFNRKNLSDAERQLVSIAGAMLVFNTLRSIPENNAALFSIDLFLQYPAMLYLGALSSTVKERLRVRSVEAKARMLSRYRFTGNSLHAR